MPIPENSMIPVKEAAKLFQVDEQEIRSWVRSYKVSSSRIGRTIFINKYDLLEILEHNYKLTHYYEHLAEKRRILEKEMSNSLLRISDLIFLFKSVKEISPILLAVIQEMALLIPKERTRNLFIDVTRKTPFSTIELKYGLSHEQVCSQYHCALKIIKSKLGFLRDYRDIMAETEQEIRRLKISNRNQEEKIHHLTELLKEVSNENMEIKPAFAGKRIPLQALELLGRPLSEVVEVNTKTKLCLIIQSLHTVEDLLRYMKKNGLSHLLTTPHYGRLTFNKFKASLIQSGVIDENEDSPLLEYLS